MYLPALLEMAIEEEVADHERQQQQRNSRGSGSGASGANNTTATDSVDIEAIETLQTDDKSFDDTVDDETEREPLQGTSRQPDEGEELSGETKVSLDDDLAGDHPGKAKKWDKKCGLIGGLLLLVILSGAMAGILMNKFAAKPAYQFQFANYFASHMVLQRAPARAIVWGYGPLTQDNRSITLLLEGGTQVQEHIVPIVKQMAGPVWKVILDPVEEAGPFKITVSLDKQPETIELVDVLFGDVWVCAGQTNMQYSMGLLDEVTEQDFMADVDDYSDIRIMTVASEKSNVEYYDVHIMQLPWSIPSKNTLAGDRIPSSQSSSHFSAVCWLYGKQLRDRLQYPIGLVSSTYSASALEDWVSHSVINDCNINVPHATSMIYNAMLHPLLSFSFYGVIWYQGESDALQLSGRLTGRYNCTFVNMITDLRATLYENTMGSTDPHFPFGFVQLAPNREGDQLTFGFTDIRWLQTANYGYVPNDSMNKTFMAVAVDLPDVNSTHKAIHSRYKVDVAERLVLGALNVAYQQRDVQYQGPRPLKYAVHSSNQSLLIHLQATGIAQKAKDGFEVCCSINHSLPCPSSYIETSYAPNRKWVAAPIESSRGRTVSLSYKDCEYPHAVAVRYLWRETPCALKKCAVYDATSDLPMPPFISQKLLGDGRWHEFSQQQTDLL